jgi:hypothetical protein
MIENIYTEFRKLSPKVTGGLVRMRQETFGTQPWPQRVHPRGAHDRRCYEMRTLHQGICEDGLSGRGDAGES